MFFSWFLCSCSRQDVFWCFLLSEGMDEADFILPFSTVMELNAEGNEEEGGNLCHHHE